MADEEAPGRRPRDRNEFADIGRDTEGARALAHHRRRCICCRPACTSREVSRVSSARPLQQRGAFAHQVELRRNRPCRGNRACGRGRHAPVAAGIFQHAVAQQQIDQLIDRGARRADGAGDLVRPHRLACRPRRNSRISKATVEAARALRDRILGHRFIIVSFIHRGPGETPRAGLEHDPQKQEGFCDEILLHTY